MQARGKKTTALHYKEFRGITFVGLKQHAILIDGSEDVVNSTIAQHPHIHFI